MLMRWWCRVAGCVVSTREAMRSGRMPTWCAPRRKPTKFQTGSPGDGSADCYLMMRFLPLVLLFAAPVEVILLVCMSSPMYLGGG